MRFFSARIVQLRCRQASAELRFAKFGFVDAARGGAVAAYSCGRSSRRRWVGIGTAGHGGVRIGIGGTGGCWGGFTSPSTAAALVVKGRMCVYRMNDKNIFNGCKVILEQIVRLTGLCEFVHVGADGLDGCRKMWRG